MTVNVHGELPANDPDLLGLEKRKALEGQPAGVVSTVHANVLSRLAEQVPPVDPKQLDKIFLDLSEAIPRERISALIEGLNRRKLMLHGVKTSDLWSHVKEHGVRPLTPEGGNASYWTSGSKAFHNGDEKMTSYDTTFFHYGVGESSPSEVTMSIVVADSAAIPYSGYEPNGYMKLNQAVPKEAACFLRVKLDKPHSGFDKNTVLRVELAMFELLEKIVEDGIQPGEVIELTLNNSSASEEPRAA